MLVRYRFLFLAPGSSMNGLLTESLSGRATLLAKFYLDARQENDWLVVYNAFTGADAAYRCCSSREIVPNMEKDWHEFAVQPASKNLRNQWREKEREREKSWLLCCSARGNRDRLRKSGDTPTRVDYMPRGDY